VIITGATNSPTHSAPSHENFFAVHRYYSGSQISLDFNPSTSNPALSLVKALPGFLGFQNPNSVPQYF
jgi:hypothetical protein